MVIIEKKNGNSEFFSVFSAPTSALDKDPSLQPRTDQDLGSISAGSFSSKEVCIALKKLNKCKPAGIDGVHPHVPLFHIFINDMPCLVQHFCKQFTDDTKLIDIIKNILDHVLLQKDINALVNWFNSLNTAFIWQEDSCDPNLDTDPHDRHCRFKMNNSILGETIAERVLGIMVDNKLNWLNQLNHVKAKAYAALGRHIHSKISSRVLCDRLESAKHR